MPRTAAPKVTGQGCRPPIANEMMKQDTNQTFHTWANIYPATTIEVLRPITEGPDRGTNAVTNALTLQEFEDVLSQYFGKQHKIKDADKIFPRQSRIDHIIAEKQNEGTTNKPAGYDNSPTNAGWKFYVKKYFQYPKQNLRMDSGLLQLANHLYTPMPDPEQKHVEKMWNRYMPSAEHRQAPITSVEQSYIHYIQAHTYISTDKNGNDIYRHHGRDETFDFLKYGTSSSFPKALISELNAKCPSCKKKFNDHRKVGLKRESERACNGVERVSRKRRFEKSRDDEQETQPGVKIGENNTPPQRAPAPASVPTPFQPQNMDFWLNGVNQLPNNSVFDPNLQMNVPVADYHQIDDPFNNSQLGDPFLSGIYASHEYDEAFAPQQNNFQVGQEDVVYYEINASGPPLDHQLYDNLMDGGALQGQGFNPQQNSDEDVLMSSLVGYNQQHDFPVGYHPQQNNIQDVPNSQQNNLLGNLVNMQPNSQPHLGAWWEWNGFLDLEWILMFPPECMYSETMYSKPIWKDLSNKITFGIEENRIPAEVRNIITDPGVPHVGGPDQANIQPNAYPEFNPIEPYLPEQSLSIDPQLSEQPEQDNPLGYGSFNIDDLFDELDKEPTPEPTPGPWTWNGGYKPQGARIGVLALPTNPQGANSG